MSIKNLRSDQLFSFFFCLVFLLIQGSLAPTQADALQAQLFSLNLIQPGLQPVPREQTEAVFQQPIMLEDQQLDDSNATSQHLSSILDQITAQSFIVIDVNSAAILVGKNIDQPLFPASSVKLMTALIASKTFDLEELVITGPEVYVIGNRVGFWPGQQWQVKDLLTAILVNSGNDAAQTLANHHSDSSAGFVQAMNDYAQQLSMHNTRFTNATGLDDYQQVSCSWDLALLAKEILQEPYLSELVAQRQAAINDAQGFNSYQLGNTNQLLAQHEQVRGIKTGTTQLAGQVLITLWAEADHQLILVVMGSQDRYQDTLLLIDWIETNFEWKPFTGL